MQLKRKDCASMRAIVITSLLLLTTDAYARGRLAELLHHRLVLPTTSKAKSFFFHGMAIAVLSCASLSCGTHMPEVSPALLQQDSTDFFVAKNVHFRHEGRSYRGRVMARIVGEDRVVIITRDETEKIVDVDNISGVRLDQHELLFARMRALSPAEHLRYVEGFVVAVFSDGYAAVKIYLEVDLRHNQQRLKQPRDAFYPINQLTLLKRSEPRREILASH